MNPLLQSHVQFLYCLQLWRRRLFAALKKRIPSKICILSRFVWLKSILFNLLCIFDVFFFFLERRQSTLFQDYFSLLHGLKDYPSRQEKAVQKSKPPKSPPVSKADCCKALQTTITHKTEEQFTHTHTLTHTHTHTPTLLFQRQAAERS